MNITKNRNLGTIWFFFFLIAREDLYILISTGKMWRRQQGKLQLHMSLLLHLLSFFIVISLEKCIVKVSGLNHTYRSVGSLRLARIQKHLDNINKLPLKTIKDIPPEMPKLRPNNDSYTKRAERNGSVVVYSAWQTWHGGGDGCPDGTIPIRRTTTHDVLRAKSLYDFGKKPRRSPALPHSLAPDAITTNGHEHAIAYIEASDEIYGAKATINVWDPSIEVVNEFSASQIWILAGSFDDSDLNSVEAGWQVNPELYGDSKPRFFTYWTSDAYQKTGCYNLLCSGFVQTSNKIAIGAAISPVSSLSGSQYDITILVWKDPKIGNWWLRFGDNTLVGYWPAELFTRLSDHATLVEWGGEVVNSRPNGEHTRTQMGSSRFAEDGFRQSSYFRDVETVDSDNSLTSAEGISTLADNNECYDIVDDSSDDWGTYFYYGGPGYNPQCL
ncbi:Neprosin [Dillenia turbinata]|uniref:Neprosin n=1 Tax=Dillenia turbinata TaxID=194707 RepID=A0AAN8UHP0_9MAGN